MEKIKLGEMVHHDVLKQNISLRKGQFFFSTYFKELCDSCKYEAQIRCATIVQLRPVAVQTQCTLDISSLGVPGTSHPAA